MKNKRKVLVCLLLNALFFILPYSVKADYSAVINGSSVRIRSGAGTNYSALYTVNTNTPITVLDKTTIPGDGCSYGWVKITYKGTEGYVCSRYVSYIDPTFNQITVADWTARTNANDVNVRTEPNKSSSSKGSLTLGVNVNVLEEVGGGTSGCSGGRWYKIQYYGDQTGYMCKNYVTLKADTIATDETYAQTLRDAGFPDSYIPFLTHLHNKYPNWQFVAKNTGYDFSYAVNAEEGKNYMQTKNDFYRISDVPAEGSTWFKANTGVIAFYMDPRNWLIEERIFMFEKLDYNASMEDSYLSLVKGIFGSGSLGADEYTIPMVTAGRTNQINPVAIASRIRVEVGANGSDSTNGCEFTFKGQQYSGYYNFFNIGAYGETIDGVYYNPIVRGLAYAAKLISRSGNVWDNIETAIVEGSQFLANGYINKGQGTQYYQKFNVSPDASASSFTHQYMTNIQAPATEGNKSYNSYSNADMLGQGFIFEIPIYNNMPSHTSLPNSGDVNNELSSLEVEGYHLSPEFDKDIITYEVYVPESVTKVKVNAVGASSLSTVTGTGEIELNTEMTDITITVTSQTMQEKKYTITIKRVNDTTAPDQPAQDAGLAIVDGGYVRNISANTTVDSIVSSLIQQGAKSVEFKNENGDILSGNDKIGTGTTMTITTLIDAKSYIVIIKGDTSGDGEVTILDLLQIQKAIKGAKQFAAPNQLAADTSDDGEVTILDLLQVLKHIKGVKPL